MMFKRLRAMAPVILIVVVGLFVTLTAMAQASTVSYVTSGEMQRFVVMTLLGGGGSLLTLITVVYTMVSTSRDAAMKLAITTATNAVAALSKLMESHMTDQFSHPAGLRPLVEKIDELRDGQEEINLKLVAILTERRVARRASDHVTAEDIEYEKTHADGNK